ncbi:MAG: DNA primase [Lachnospiraceae bacterium]|nr:DNA primase [Lachnospiraceae bacterium]
MFIPDETVEEIRSRVDIVEVISSYVRLQKKGSNYFGLCPFHSEKSPSFSVSPQRQMYHCFGCDVSGNVFTFLMKYENYTFPEAVEALAAKAGVTIPKQEYSEEAKKRESRKEKLFAANKEAATYFYHLLRSPMGEKGLSYLEGRRISAETRQRFGLGYAAVTPDDLTKYLKEKGFSDEILIDAGLSSFDEKRGLHDKFWNRVIFPIFDTNNRVIGFGGRVMGDGKPKYLNSQETLIFDKGKNLYGLNLARSSKSPFFILCEGYIDVIAMHQAGFPMAVASLGTAFTEGQARLIGRYAKEVILAYDSDEAGIKAALRASAILRGTELSCRVMTLSPYKDPDEFIVNLGKEEFEKRIREAENSFFFELRILQRDFRLDDPDSKTRFFREAAAKLCTFREELERDNYITSVAEYYHIDPEALRSLVRSSAASSGDVVPAFRPKETGNARKVPQDQEIRSQRLLLTYLIERPSLYPQVKAYLTPSDFSEDCFRKAAESLFTALEEGKVEPAAIISMFTDEEEQTKVANLFTAHLPGGMTKQEHEKAFHDSLNEVKRLSYDRFAGEGGDDPPPLDQVIGRRRELDEIAGLHIRMEE